MKSLFYGLILRYVEQLIHHIQYSFYLSCFNFCVPLELEGKK